MTPRKRLRPAALIGILILPAVLIAWALRDRSPQVSQRDSTAVFFAAPPTTASAAASPAGKAIVLPAEKEHALETFAQWLQDYAGAAPIARADTLAEGKRLAANRRAVMEELMQRDPREALRQALTLDVWRSLPPELQELVEEPFSALANFRVLPVCAGRTPEAASAGRATTRRDVVRLTEIEGQAVLDSFVFGRRDALATKEGSPVQGIRLSGLAALREEVFHALEAREIAVAETIYPAANPRPDLDFATGQPLGAQMIVALAGGKIFKFASRASFDTFNQQIAALDQQPDPHSGAAVLFLPSPAPGAAGAGFDLAGAMAHSEYLASAWTETKKKVFMIRCDFSDQPHPTNPVVNAGTYSALLNSTVSNAIRDFSYGKTWIEGSVSAAVLRLPQTAAYYATIVSAGTSRNQPLLDDAKAAYLAANPGFNFGDYDIVGVWFVSIGMRSGGVAYGGLAGGSQIWIQGSTSAGLHVHEFGHNYGLGHASYWTPSGGSTNPVDPAGTNDEYGDPFDVMGSGEIPDGVFHSEAKQRLNWLATGEWSDATANGSGTYRIHRIDHANATGGRGLRITRAASDYYWLSYRRQFSNDWLRAGVSIVWKRSGQSRSWLIDTTPGTIAGSSDRTDGSVLIGRTYADTTANVFITPLARGGTAPGEYLDVRVNLGPFPGNTAPSVTIEGPSTIPARQTCIFTAHATDANGDVLAYHWDFGQGFAFDNHSSAAFAWSSGGTYTVKVTVSDMKGQTAQATKMIAVTDPILNWTTRANASGGHFRGLVASPTKVLAVGEDYSSFRGPVATSSDGITWTATQLPGNGQARAGIWDGTQFLLAGEDYDFTQQAWLGCVFTSPTGNANSWTRRIYAGPSLYGIAFGGGVYVAVGNDGTIRRSTDGTTWTPVASGTLKGLERVAFGGGRFVAVGYDYDTSTGTVLTSPDGTTWTDASAGAGLASWQALTSVAWVGDRFVASGFYSKLRHSLDLGATFLTTRTRTEETPALAYGNGIWFAAGVDQDAAGADIDLVSSDGANWGALATPSLDDRRAAIFFNNTFITAGDNHSIRQSGTLLPAATGFTTWRESRFPDHGPLSTFNSDHEGDGIPNLLEYAFARSPFSGAGLDGSAALPQSVVVAGNPQLSDRIALRFSLPEPAASDLRYVVEATDALGAAWTPLATKVGTGAWTWNPGGTSRIFLGPISSGRVEVTVGDLLPMNGASRRFLRLRSSVNQ